ncbi:MAG: glycosyltransferase [Alphaproteobacteria bacterium]|nr:glycosyltransferase [Alphaproteobacteria bacterium]
MRILLLARYGRLGASSRVRFAQFLPHLKAAGHEVVSEPLFDDDYLTSLYDEGKRQTTAVLAAYANRLGVIRTRGHYDLVWMEKEALPWLPASFEAWLLRGGPPIVVDYDDAVFHRYDRHPSSLIRGMLSNKIDRVMEAAALVVAGNDYLAERAREAGARRVVVLPTVVDLDRYAAPPPKNDEPPVIGWIGTPLTGGYLAEIREVLAGFAETGAAKLVLIGAGDQVLPGMTAERLPWHEDSEAADIAKLDIGIMPIPDEPFERGKCGYKLIQYMAQARPVVASPVGVNVKLVNESRGGFLAGSAREWRDALSKLISDSDLRRRMGRDGRRTVQAKYCVDVIAPELIRLFREVAAQAPSARR